MRLTRAAIAIPIQAQALYFSFHSGIKAKCDEAGEETKWNAGANLPPASRPPPAQLIASSTSGGYTSTEALGTGWNEEARASKSCSATYLAMTFTSTGNYYGSTVMHHCRAPGTTTRARSRKFI